MQTTQSNIKKLSLKTSLKKRTRSALFIFPDEAIRD